MQKKRKSWTEYMEMASDLFLKDLVFIDESGVNTNMERRCGRATGGRVVDSAPLNAPVTTPIYPA